MKKCPHCAEEIQDEAETCPYCSMPTADRSPIFPPSVVTPIRIVDIDVPFGRLVVLILKLTFASIPAAIVVFIGSAVLAGLLAGIFGGVVR